MGSWTALRIRDAGEYEGETGLLRGEILARWALFSGFDRADLKSPRQGSSSLEITRAFMAVCDLLSEAYSRLLDPSWSRPSAGSWAEWKLLKGQHSNGTPPFKKGVRGNQSRLRAAELGRLLRK